MLGRHDRALHDEQVELGVEHVLRELLDPLRRERRARGDAAGLDLADALADELGLDRLLVELLHPARRLLGRQRRDLLEDRVGVFVARPETFEVQAREAAEPTDLDRGRRRDDAVHRGRHHRQLELVRVDLPRDVDVFGIACAPARHDRDVVEPVRPPPRLADPDLDFHMFLRSFEFVVTRRASLEPSRISPRRGRVTPCSGRIESLSSGSSSDGVAGRVAARARRRVRRDRGATRRRRAAASPASQPLITRLDRVAAGHDAEHLDAELVLGHVDARRMSPNAVADDARRSARASGRARPCPRPTTRSHRPPASLQSRPNSSSAECRRRSSAA